MDIHDVWHNLEQTASAMEKGEGDWYTMVVIAQQSIRRLMDFSPEEVINEILQSTYPPKAMLNWLLHEGQKIEGVSVVKLQALCDHWNEELGDQRGRMHFPPLA
jgi:hypothetical protein